MRKNEPDPPGDPTYLDPDDAAELERRRLSRNPGVALSRSPLRTSAPPTLEDSEPSIIVQDDLVDEHGEPEDDFEPGEAGPLGADPVDDKDEDHDDVDEADDEADDDDADADDDDADDADDADADDADADDADDDDADADDADDDEADDDDAHAEESEGPAQPAQPVPRIIYSPTTAAGERERFVYQAPSAPAPAPRAMWVDDGDDDDEDFELIARRKRRRINLYVIFACAVVVFAGYGLGNLGGNTSPSDATRDQATVDAALADAQTQLDTTGDAGSATDTDSGDVTDSSQDIGPTPDGIAAAQLPPPRPVVVPPPRAPDSPAVLTNIDEALADLDAHRWPEAKAAYDAILDRTPNHPRALYGRARALMGMKRYIGVLTDLEALFATDPDHPKGLLLGATAATELGRTDDARRYYVRYLEAWPKTTRAEEVRKLLEAL